MAKNIRVVHDLDRQGVSVWVNTAKYANRWIHLGVCMRNGVIFAYLHGKRIRAEKLTKFHLNKEK